MIFSDGSVDYGDVRQNNLIMLNYKLIRIELTSGRGLLLLRHAVLPFIGLAGMEIPGVERGFGVDRLCSDGISDGPWHDRSDSDRSSIRAAQVRNVDPKTASQKLGLRCHIVRLKKGVRESAELPGLTLIQPCLRNGPRCA